MEERMKRIEEYTKTMRELISKLIEENPDSRSEIYNEMWGAYLAGMYDVSPKKLYNPFLSLTMMGMLGYKHLNKDE